MSNRSDADLLNDIREAIDRIQSYIGAGNYADFLGDIKTQDAVIRNIEILGEAAKLVSEEVRATYPSIPWRSMAGMRNRLVHDYFGVNLDIVWQVSVIELPKIALILADNP
ncbi:MAG: DUF86 domain-containing protein [Blastocatellia bacterium]|jgi:uncharacterized protein with HEPN domain